MVTKQVKAGSKETATAPTRSAESEPSLNLPGAPPPGAPRLPAARGGRHRARQGCRRRSRTLRQAVATAGGHRLLGAARGGSFHEPSASLPRAFPQAVDASSALQRQMAEQGGAASSVAGGLEFRACPQEPSPSLLGALLQVAEGLEFKPALPAPKLPAAKPTGLQGLLASLDGEMQPRCSRDAAEGRPRGGRGAGIGAVGRRGFAVSPSAPSARPPTCAHPPPAPPSRATGKKKMSTMEKSRHDWGNFKSKQDEATRDEMDRFAKDGYLAKQARGTS